MATGLQLIPEGWNPGEHRLQLVKLLQSEHSGAQFMQVDPL